MVFSIKVYICKNKKKSLLSCLEAPQPVCFKRETNGWFTLPWILILHFSDKRQFTNQSYTKSCRISLFMSAASREGTSVSWGECWEDGVSGVGGGTGAGGPSPFCPEERGEWSSPSVELQRPEEVQYRRQAGGCCGVVQPDKPDAAGRKLSIFTTEYHWYQSKHFHNFILPKQKDIKATPCRFF